MAINFVNRTQGRAGAVNVVLASRGGHVAKGGFATIKRNPFKAKPQEPIAYDITEYSNPSVGAFDVVCESMTKMIEKGHNNKRVSLYLTPVAFNIARKAHRDFKGNVEEYLTERGTSYEREEELLKKFFDLASEFASLNVGRSPTEQVIKSWERQHKSYPGSAITQEQQALIAVVRSTWDALPEGASGTIEEELEDDDTAVEIF